MEKLKKGLIFTDIHFGKKSNSPQHNQDCLDFIDWVCGVVEDDPSIDYVAFLGDWYENRSTIGIVTLNYSHAAASKLNDLGKPIYFVVGNHDLLYRNTRDVHSITPFAAYENFVIIDQPRVVNEICGSVLFSPFLFEREYPDLAEYLKLPVWMGHFEFQGFVVTGHSIKMQHGPEGRDFAGPKHILSGHFHQRQDSDNIHYIGNTFPMNFSDAGDRNRGCAIYDNVHNTIRYINWPAAPQYVKTTVSKLLSGVRFPKQARVNCVMDEEITYEESLALRKAMIDTYKLREFVFTETTELHDVLIGSDADEEAGVSTEDDDAGDALSNKAGSSIDELVVDMLQTINTDKVDTNTLIKIYTGLQE